MRSIKGFILKDLLNLNHYKITLLITIVLFSFISISQKNMAGFFPSMVVMMIGMIALSTFSYDEIAKTDKFILTLPTNRKEVVKAKYILIIGLTVLGAIFAFGVHLLLAYFAFQEAPNVMNYLFSVLGGLFGVAIIESIQIPSIYKWGVEKGKIQMFIVFGFVIIVGVILAFLAKNMNLNISSDSLEQLSMHFGLPILLLLTFLMYFISYQVSIKIYRKKEIA